MWHERTERTRGECFALPVGRRQNDSGDEDERTIAFCLKRFAMS